MTPDETTNTENEEVISDAPVENTEDATTPVVADEAPADEAPADEAPADEAPADEAPADEAPADVIPHAMYKVTGVINITDGQGQVQGQYPLGSVHEFPADLGNVYVESGVAELVTEE